MGHRKRRIRTVSDKTKGKRRNASVVQPLENSAHPGGLQLRDDNGSGLGPTCLNTVSKDGATSERHRL